MQFQVKYLKENSVMKFFFIAYFTCCLFTGFELFFVFKKLMNLKSMYWLICSHFMEV